MNWKTDLQMQGYVHLRGLTPAALVTRALKAIQDDLAANYDPARQTEYDNQSYCPRLVGTSRIKDLLVKCAIHEILDDLLGIDNFRSSGGQIAIRRARNCQEPIPPHPHIDGFSTGLNGVPPDRIYNHTALVGVFLSRISSPFAGNFTIWPGSHYEYERHFRERGRRAMCEPMPELELGKPVQLLCEVGDVVLAHYLLGHTAAVNTGDADRIAVFFRVVLSDLESDNWRYLTNMWDGWCL